MTSIARAGRNIVSQILGHVSANPDAIAVDAPSGHLTYIELYEYARHVAAALEAANVKYGDIVGVCLASSSESVAALVGTWLVGGVFLPLDPAHPDERLEDISAASSLSVLVGDRTSRSEDAQFYIDVHALPQALVDVDADSLCDDGSLAYVIYTSGSTGRPKGVEIGHGELKNFVTAFAPVLGGPGTTVLNLMAPSFDGWLMATLPVLACGATIVLRSGTEAVVSGIDMTPNVVMCTPTILQNLELRPDGLATVIVGGEVCPPALVERWSEEVRFINAYGPTETTICVSWADSDREDDLSTLGRPVAGANLYVLGEDMKPLATGGRGELYIGGVPIGRGYRNEPALTASRFMPDPFFGSGARMFRTGDIVEEDRDGRLRYIGRNDDQVKLRGLNVNLSEVERVALEVAGVDAASAYVRDDGLTLGLAIVPGFSRVARSEIDKRLRAALPEYFSPSEIVGMDAFPMTAAGKVNRSEVSRLARTPERRSGNGPSTPVEQRLAMLWHDVLGEPTVDVDLPFFDVGGHSLLIARLVGLVHEEWNVNVSVAELLESPTIRGMSNLVESAIGK